MTSSRLYIDYYLPHSLETVPFNQKSARQLLACSRVNDVPHMIIRGGEGSGRKTLANLYIKSKYHLENLRIKYRTVAIKNGSRTLNLQMLYSDYHYQFDPSQHGVYDRFIIHVFTKDLLQTKPVSNIPYHSVIINNADRLTAEAQQSLRRTLEKNVSNCRFIFIVNQEANLIEPLISRCIQIRMASPTEPEICQILEHICQQEHKLTPPEQLREIAIYSRRNLSRAINLLQTVHLIQLPPTEKLDFTMIDVNEQCVDQLGYDLIRAKTLPELQQLRQGTYDLLIQCVEPSKILKKLFYHLMAHMEKEKVNDAKKHQLIGFLDQYERSLKLGSKPIYSLEGFMVAYICLGGTCRFPPCPPSLITPDTGRSYKVKV